MQRWKAEQERRPLPRQARLRTLLKGIPVIWLDPVCAALDVDTRPLKHRKDRERAIVRTLLDAYDEATGEMKPAARTSASWAGAFRDIYSPD